MITPQAMILYAYRYLPFLNSQTRDISSTSVQTRRRLTAFFRAVHVKPCACRRVDFVMHCPGFDTQDAFELYFITQPTSKFKAPTLHPPPSHSSSHPLLPLANHEVPGPAPHHPPSPDGSPLQHYTLYLSFYSISLVLCSSCHGRRRQQPG